MFLLLGGILNATAADLRPRSTMPHSDMVSLSEYSLMSISNTPSIVQPMILSDGSNNIKAVTEDNHDWGQWYEEMTGNFHALSVSPVADAVLNGYDISGVTVMRRDDASNSDLAQLKISGIFVNDDFYVYYVPSTGELYWDEQILSVEVPKTVKDGIIEEGRTPYSNIHIKGISSKGANNVDYYSLDMGLSLGNLAFLCEENYQYSCWNSRVRKTAYDNAFYSAGWEEHKVYQGNVATLHFSDNPDVKSVEYVVYHKLNDSEIECGGKIFDYSEFMALLNDREAEIYLTAPLASSVDIRLNGDGYHAARFRIESTFGEIYREEGVYVINSTPDAWRSIGTGTVVMTRNSEACYSDKYVNTPQSVEVQENVDNPNLIRFVNPFNVCYNLDEENTLPSVQGSLIYDTEHDYYMMLDISDPTDAFQYNVCMPYSIKYKGQSSFSIIGLYEEHMSLEGGILTSSTDSDVKYTLPQEVTFALESDDEGNCSVQILSDKVARIYYTAFNPTASMTVVKAFEALSSALDKSMTSGEINGFHFASVTQSGSLPASWFRPYYKRPFRLVALSVDANGNIISKEVIAPVNNNKIELYHAGVASYQDLTLPCMFGISPLTFDVDVYLSNDAPGCYFLRNVYYNGQWPYNRNGIYTVATGDSYMMIDCNDPDGVLIADYDTGFGLDGSHAVIMHHIATDYTLTVAKQLNFTGAIELQDDYYVITFPGYVFNLALINNGQQYSYGAKGPVIYIKSDLDGIDSVEEDVQSADNCVKEYYTLQGIRVSNPQKGIYIVRQGTNVSKIYVK